MSSKQLYKHALPVVALAIGLFIVSALAVSSLAVDTTTSNRDTVSRILTGQLLNVTPTADGLIHVSANQDSYTNASLAPVVQINLGQVTQSTTSAHIDSNKLGQTTRLKLMLSTVDTKSSE